MAPESAGEEVEAAVVAADLVGAKDQAVGVADEEVACSIAAGADLAHHPARRAAIQVQVRIRVEQSLKARLVFGISTQVRAEPRVIAMLGQGRLPDLIMLVARSELGC